MSSLPPRDAIAIIVAGGSGKRFGGRIRKQYLLLRGRPIVWWSLHAFQRSPSIKGLILVAPSEDLATLRRRMSRWSLNKLIAIVKGGTTRADSVRNGLKAVPPRFGWIAVHDAVRPLVTSQIIEKTLRAARRHGAAIPASPSKDTVKLANGSGRVRQTPPRETVWLAQTPQIFERRLLERAHARAGRAAVTDDAQVVERLGATVMLVPAPAENIKVTLPADYLLAKHILKDRS